MELLTVQETATLLKVTPITVRRYIASGQLPAIKVGRGVRVRRESLDRMLAPFTAPITPQRARLLAGRPLTYDDPLWELVGSATDAAPTDASRKHEYLADALDPRRA